jgi:glycosyltransferase involved in cell wall biosynthesis
MRHIVVDTRGERWMTFVSLPKLVAAVCTMAWDRIVDQDRIHHIHIAGRGSTLRKLILAQVAHTLGCVYLLHLHDYDYASDFEQRPLWLQQRVQQMFRRANHVIALGNRDVATLSRLVGVETGKISIIHNCVPDPGQREHRTESGPVNILFLGQLGERKGVPELLAALSKPNLSMLPWRAVLAGGGPVEDYRREVAVKGLADRVTMPGWLSEAETRKLCIRADILVLPSRAEGMAMAVLEGMAYGMAVVTTRVGAHEEVIDDGVTGIFVPIGDDVALANALERLITNRDERDRLSRHARALYLSRLSMGSYLRDLNSLYRRVTLRVQARTVEE